MDELDAPVVFSHCDLLPGNIIYNHESNETTFIDLEYGGYEYRGFDIANHFCEFAGYTCDYSRYPTKEVQQEWIKIYLGSSVSNSEIEEEAEILYLEVVEFCKAAHLLWVVWALVQASMSDIEFDYMTYAV